MPVKGRPKCQKICCTQPQQIEEMYSTGKSSDEIGKELGVSDTHIVQQLRKMSVVMKTRWFYNSTPNRKGRGKRTNPLWELSDEDLFHTPADILVERMGVRKHSVFRIRWRRKKGELTTTISKTTTTKANNVV